MVSGIFDVVIIGQGFAGAAAAVTMGRAGYRVATIDKHAIYPQEFRAEQIVGEQVGIMQKLDLLRDVVGDAPRIDHVSAYDASGFIKRTMSPHYGLDYPDMVAGLRAAIPASVTRIIGSVTNFYTISDCRMVSLADGRIVRARLVVLATGLHCGLHAPMNITSETVSERHSIAMGFDVEMTARDDVVVFLGDATTGVDYLTIFPFKDGRTRANLFCYRPLPPLADYGFHGLLPGLNGAVGPVRIIGRPQIRSNSLVVNKTTGGVVAIGDAAQTPCPTAGTGIRRLLIDVAALMHYAPRWLDGPDLVADDDLALYDQDPERLRENARCLREALYMRDRRLGTTWPWRLHRWRVRQQAVMGMV